MKEDWLNELKLFTEPELRSEILKHGKVMQAEPGDVLIKEGQHLNFLPIVIRGKYASTNKWMTARFYCITSVPKRLA